MNEIPLEQVALDEVKGYLVRQGWHAEPHPNQRILRLISSEDAQGEIGSVILPQSEEYTDAQTMVAEALRTLAVFEGRSLSKVVDRIVHWGRDILRARLFKVLGEENSLPLDVAAETIWKLKQFVAYSAYTESDPQPFFDRAGGISATFAKSCRFGHTFHGSFGLVVESPIAFPDVLPMDGNVPASPFERKVFDRIGTALTSLRQAVEVGSVEPILAIYKQGFSANMLEALADMYERAEGRKVEYDLSWSPQLRSNVEALWKPFTFGMRAYNFAKMAASELVKVEEIPASIILGRIVELKSEMPPGLDEQQEFEHMITMRWEREKGQDVKIRIPLTPKEYIEACDAHKEGRQVRIIGFPEKRGKIWVLTAPSSFAVQP